MLKKKSTPTKAISKEQCASEYEKRAMGIIQLNFTRAHDLLASAASDMNDAKSGGHGGGKRLFVLTENGLMPTQRRLTGSSLNESASASAEEDVDGSGSSYTHSNDSFDESQELIDMLQQFDAAGRPFKNASSRGRRTSKQLSPASSSVSPADPRSPQSHAMIATSDDYRGSDVARLHVAPNGQSPSSRKLSAQNLTKKRKHPNPLDISTADGAELLQPDEYELCTNLRIQPSVYFHARDTLVENGKSRGFYKKSAAQKMLRIDVNKTGKLYDFFYAKGWLPTSPDYL